MEALTVFFALIFLPSSMVFAAAPIQIEPHGAVEIRDPGGPWTALESAQPLAPGERARTGEGGSALILFPDGSKLLLSPRSDFKLGRADARKTEIRLLKGRLKAVVAGLFSSRLEVQTPTSVAAVRGTQFEVSVNRNGVTRVGVAEGALDVSDRSGKTAVVSSEETIDVTPKGLGIPRIVSLKNPLAQPAANAYRVAVVHANARTRRMVEDMRNLELKADEAMMGKDLIDAFGRRVRLDEFLLRPQSNEFQILSLAQRSNRFDWAQISETFSGTLPNDISQVPALVQGTFLSSTRPSNYLTNFDFYATNTIDAEHETIALGAPIAVNLSGYGKGTLYYPQSIDWNQFLSGPGVPGGTRTQFSQHTDYGQTSSGLFTWTQSIVNNAGTLAQLDQFQLDPANSADVAAGGCSLGGGETCFDYSPAPINAFGSCTSSNCGQFAGFATSTSFPSGPNKADYLAITTYPDASSVSVEKFLIQNDGSVIDFSNATASTFADPGNYSLEITIGSSLFQGRNIDVLFSPEILAQKNDQTQTPDANTP
ncbi:MAG: FecR family protein [Elusimicrobiota bacterium]